MVGGAFFSNILAPFAETHTPVGPGEIGIVFLINTFFVVVALRRLVMAAIASTVVSHRG